MNRTDRLVALVMLLQSRRVITAGELAAHFEITERTVYRDLAALGESGVPILGEPGVGYSLMRGYQLPPVMFTPQEAAALVTSAMLAEQMTDQSVRDPVRTALGKLTAILPADLQSSVHRLQDTMAVQSRKPTAGPVPLSRIQAAAAERRLLRLHYRGAARGEATEREVEPLGLVYYLEQWHLIAWCRLRKEARDFRVDRILKCEALPVQLPPRAGFDLQSYIRTHQCPEDGTLVVIRVHRILAETLRRYWGPAAEETDSAGDWITFRLRTGSLAYLARWLLSFGDKVIVIEPDTLRAELVSAAEAALRHHTHSHTDPNSAEAEEKVAPP